MVVAEPSQQYHCSGGWTKVGRMRWGNWRRATGDRGSGAETTKASGARAGFVLLRARTHLRKKGAARHNPIFFRLKYNILGVGRCYHNTKLCTVRPLPSPRRRNRRRHNPM